MHLTIYIQHFTIALSLLSRHKTYFDVQIGVVIEVF